MHTQRLEGGPAEPVTRQLPELVCSRLDSWYPCRLPARFLPRRGQRTPGLLRPLPLLLAAVLLALLAAATLAGSSRGLTDALVNLSGMRPAATPTPHPQGAVPVDSLDAAPSGASTAGDGTDAPSAPAPAPALAGTGQSSAQSSSQPTPTAGLASGARMVTSPTTSPGPLSPPPTSSVSTVPTTSSPPALRPQTPTPTPLPTVAVHASAML